MKKWLAGGSTKGRQSAWLARKGQVALFTTAAGEITNQQGKVFHRARIVTK
jgi:hypothetical protein